MGLLTNELGDIRKKVQEVFGAGDNYLVVFKHNGVEKNLFKLIVSSVWYVMDNSRTFILYVDQKGIHEKEMTNSLKGNFLLMPWHEIEDFQVQSNRGKAILCFTHLGKEMAYEVPFSGKPFKDNWQNFNHLEGKDWHRI